MQEKFKIDKCGLGDKTMLTRHVPLIPVPVFELATKLGQVHDVFSNNKLHMLMPDNNKIRLLLLFRKTVT